MRKLFISSLTLIFLSSCSSELDRCIESNLENIELEIEQIGYEFENCVDEGKLNPRNIVARPVDFYDKNGNRLRGTYMERRCSSQQIDFVNNCPHLYNAHEKKLKSILREKYYPNSKYDELVAANKFLKERLKERQQEGMYKSEVEKLLSQKYREAFFYAYSELSYMKMEGRLKDDVDYQLSHLYTAERALLKEMETEEFLNSRRKFLKEYAEEIEDFIDSCKVKSKSISVREYFKKEKENQKQRKEEATKICNRQGIY